MSFEVILAIIVLVGFGAFLYLRKKKADANRGANGSSGSGGEIPKTDGKDSLK